MEYRYLIFVISEISILRSNNLIWHDGIDEAPA